MTEGNNMPVEWLHKLKIVMKFKEKPTGSEDYPVKSCKDLKMQYPDVENGEYWIDPNMGSPKDAFIVNCTFTKTAAITCLKPKQESFQKRKWVWNGEDQFQWFLGDINSEVGEVSYSATRSQLAFLRMENKMGSQDVTYHCRNSHAHADDQTVNTYFKVLSYDGESEMSNTESHIKVVSDGCTVKDNQWHNTVFKVAPKDIHQLPISDIGVIDVADEQEEFGVDVGPVCFH